MLELVKQIVKKFIISEWKDVFIYGFIGIIGRFLNYLLVPVYTRMMQPDTYGEVTIFYASMSFAIVIGAFSIDSGYFRFIAYYADKLSAIFSCGFLINSIISFLCGCLFLLIFVLSGWHISLYALGFFFLILILDSIAVVPLAYLRKEKKITQYTLIKLAGIIINLLLNLYFYLFLKKTIALYVFASNFVSSLVSFLLLIPLVLKMFSLNALNIKILKELFLYSYPLTLSAFLGMINENADKIMISFLGSGDEYTRQAATGIYSACYKIGVFIYLVSGAVRLAFEPILFQLLSQNKIKEFKIHAIRIVQVVSLSVLFTCFYIELLKIFVSPKYYEGLKIVPIVSFAYLYYTLMYLNSFWYKTTGKTIISVLITSVGAFLTILMNFILIPIMGYEGAAWTTLFVYVIMTIFSWLLSKKYFFLFNWKFIVGVSIICFIVYVIGFVGERTFNIPMIFSGIPLMILNTLCLELFLKYKLNNSNN